MQAERKAREMAADAAAARAETAAVEARLIEQADYYEDHIAGITRQTKQVSSRSPCAVHTAM